MTSTAASTSGQPTIYLGLNAYVESQSASGNYSVIRYIVSFYETTNHSTTYSGIAGNNYASVSVNGSGAGTYFTYDFRPGGNQSYTLLNSTVVVYHNADGTHADIGVYAAVDTNGNSVGDASTSFSLALPRIPAGASAPTSVALTPQSGAIDVAWDASADNRGSAITGYRLQAALNSSFSIGLVTHDVGVTTSGTISGLAPSSTYYVRAAGLNGSYAGIGDWSDTQAVAVLGGIYVGVAGAWVDAQVFAGVNGSWVPVVVKAGRSGSWVSPSP